jgi:excisionase family DNA binding protein
MDVITQEAARILAAQVVAEPVSAKTLTQDHAIAVVGILGAALVATQAQAVRPTVATAAPALADEFAGRLAVNTEEAARLLGLEEAHIQDLCRRGVIPACKPGKAWLIRVEAIREWLAAQEQEQQDRRATHVVASAPSRRPAARLGALPKNSRRTA